MRWIFIGDRGLRAGWRFAAYVASVIAIVVMESILVRALIHVVAPHTHPSSLVAAPLNETLFLIAILIPTLVAARREGRALRDFYVSASPRSLGFGALFGILLLSAFALLLQAVGVMTIARGSGVTLAPTLVWTGMFCLVAVVEEIGFRGYPLRVLARGIGFWPAAIVISVLFGAIHISNSGEGLFAAFAAGLLSLALCASVARTGALGWAIGVHAGWDWAESFLWGARDSGTAIPQSILVSTAHGAALLSGGTAGPEGSILVLLPLAAIVAGARLLPNRARANVPLAA